MAAPALVLGPILRHIGGETATVWVETDGACTVQVLGAETRTFCVAGHHYALALVDGLEPGRAYEYELRLDGRRVWPAEDSPFPPSSIRPVGHGRVRLAFGSCRVSAPHHPPFTRRRASDRRGFGVDALRALALDMARRSRDEWPDALLLLGDQIYADEPSPHLRARLRPGSGVPGSPPEALEDFPDYAVAYRNAWDEPAIRWLLSTVPTAMVFDDHEIEAEWKISQAWVDEMRSQEWYERRLTGALMAYWLYQHLGNLSPAELRASALLRRAAEAEDAAPLLREFAAAADRQAGHSRWSFCWDLGRTRLLVIDSRAGRELSPGRRRIVDPGEWTWIRERAGEDYDDLLLASSVPFLLAPALHDFEAWNEAVADGAWGRRAARVAERIRRAASLDHWPAFGRSFLEFAELLEQLGAGRLRAAPRSIVLLSGDVHHCYLAEVAFRRSAGVRSGVWQAVCSGLRKPLDPRERLGIRLASSPASAVVARGLRAAVGAARPSLRWRFVHPPAYENQIGSVDVAPERTSVTVASTRGADWRRPALRTVFSHDLVPRARR